MMNLLGIIAEYNPFHNGHAYQLAQAKKRSQCDAAVVIMSGHFTQRGEPALFNKWQRAEMALQGGADLILELPVAYSVRSAYYFALGGVLSLAAAGVQTLAFGSECADLASLSAIAELLAAEPISYRQLLTQFLEQGLSYPQAQQSALNALLPKTGHLFAQPNNLLAIHYLQIIRQYHLSMKPLAIMRQRALHGEQLAPENSLFASGTAIRHLLLEQNDAWRSYVPSSTETLISRALLQGYHPVTLEHFSQPLLTLLRRDTAQSLTCYPEIREGLEHLLWREAQNASNLSALCHAVKSKRYTYTRLQRLLCALLLNLTTESLQCAAIPAYLRVLGFNATGRRVLKQLKSTAALPVITKSASAKHILSSAGQALFDLDCRATDIYHLAYSDPELSKGRRDFYQSPVILNAANS